MSKNITLELDEAVLEQVTRAARSQDQSVSEWVAHLIEATINRDADHAATRLRAIANLDKTFHLGGKPLSRDEIYDRRADLR